MTTPEGWQATTYGAVFTETHERRGDRVDLPVLSVTKTRGPMLASERFGKALHGRDLAKYRVARRGTFVADPMLLWDGAIGRQEASDCGLVSPDYRVYDLAEHVASEFMRYVVRDPRMLRHYQGGARGTNVRRNRITREDFLRIPFQLPPLTEQRKIAAILSAVDEVIEKTEALIEQLKVVKKTMMQRLLTRGLPGRHTRFKQTEIGEVPEEWEVRTLGEICSKIVDGVHQKPNYVKSGIPFVTVKNLTAGSGISFADLNYVTPGDHAQFIRRANPERGDVLLSKDGTLGVARVVETDAPFSIFVSVALLKPVRGALDGHFLRAALEADAVASQFGLARTGSALKHIHLVDMRRTRCPVPPIEEQRAIAEKVRTLEERATTEVCGLLALRSVRQALMSVLLTGELRVTHDEDTA